MNDDASATAIAGKPGATTGQAYEQKRANDLENRFTLKSNKPGLIPVFGIAVSITMLLYGLVMAASIYYLTGIVNFSTDTREHVLPLISDTYRTAINLERLGRFGETVLMTTDKHRRRENRIAAQMLGNDSIYETNPAAQARIQAAVSHIRSIAENRNHQDKLSAQIETAVMDLDNAIHRLHLMLLPQTRSDLAMAESSLMAEMMNLRSLTLTTIAASSAKTFTEAGRQIEQLLSRIEEYLSNRTLANQAGISDILSMIMDQCSQAQQLRDSWLRLETENNEIWDNAKHSLDEMRDGLSMTAATISAERFSRIADSARRSRTVFVIGFAAMLLALMLAVIFVQKSILAPLIAATQGLETIRNQETAITLAPASIREISAVIDGVQSLGRMVENLKSIQAEIRNKNIILDETNQKLVSAHQEIMAGIRYAKLIQSSLLPGAERLKTYLPQNFVIWMPRDIVGGDIIYSDSFDDGFILALLDCTGHGVPGAFMTMIAFASMERIVRGESCRDPAQILSRLNRLVKALLKQDTAEALSDDGLDAAVCYIKTQAVTNETASCPIELVFAGARMPLIVFYNEELQIIKGHRQSLGYKRSNVNYQFANHRITIRKGMSFYLYSDGLTDQTGGNPERSYGAQRFMRLLTENSGLPFEIQKDIILQDFNAHSAPQRLDDVTVVGFGF